MHAASGHRALDLLSHDPFDAALLDIMMPGLDGLAVLRKIREKWPSLPVSMLTAKGDETDRVVGLELGADDYLPRLDSSKPFAARATCWQRIPSEGWGFQAASRLWRLVRRKPPLRATTL